MEDIRTSNLSGSIVKNVGW